MIIFEKVRWKNFLSTGNTFSEINLLRSQNTLIIGNNGAGKSTILDALCFGLFGKPFRKINKPQLLNSINNQQCVVEIEFSIGKKKYKVIRGIKPNTFEVYCNDVMVDQDAKAKDYQEYLEKFILKLNFKSFTQVVILGSASFVPFMQLTPADRRAIIEDLLDIQIFSTMNSLAKEKIAINKDALVKNEHQIDLNNTKVELQKHNIDEAKKHNDAEIEKKKTEIENSEQQITKLNSDIVLIQKHIDVLQSKISDKLAMENKSSKLLQLESKLETRIKKIDKDVSFYEGNDSCPTCKQDIHESFKGEKVAELSKTKGEVSVALTDLSNQITKTSERITEIQNVLKHIQSHNNEIIKHNSTITAVNSYISKIQKEINELSNKKDNLEEENEKLKEFNDQLKQLDEERKIISDEKKYYDLAAALLKDTGIKTKIIRQYLPIMNKLVNKYLTAMDFFVNFNINENFEETIKSRHRDEFSYANFSEGEKMRIDLGLLFTWRQIAKLKNSTNTNSDWSGLFNIRFRCLL